MNFITTNCGFSLKISKSNKSASWNKGVQVGIFQKSNKICCMIIQEVNTMFSLIILVRYCGGVSPELTQVLQYMLAGAILLIELRQAASVSKDQHTF